MRRYEPMRAIRRALAVLTIVLAVRTALITNASAVTAGPLSQANDEIVISDKVTCQLCEIVIARPHRTVQPPDGFSTLPFRPEWDSRGYFYVPQSDVGELPWVFDSTGAVLGQLGGEGAGPGEFRRARHVVPFGDSLFVLDNRLSRVSVFDSSATFVRSFMGVPNMLSGVWLPGVEQLLVNANVPDASNIGRPFFQFSREGQQGKFGRKDLTILRYRDPNYSSLAIRRVMVADGMDGMLAGTVYRYGIELWSSGGVLLSRYVRESSWFPPFQRPTTSNRSEQPPSPTLVDLRRDDQGRVWTLAWVAAENWRSATTRLPSGREDRDYTRYWDTMIEVLDLDSRSVVARTIIPDLCVRLSPRGELVCDQRLEDGSYFIDFRRITFR